MYCMCVAVTFDIPEEKSVSKSTLASMLPAPSLTTLSRGLSREMTMSRQKSRLKYSQREVKVIDKDPFADLFSSGTLWLPSDSESGEFGERYVMKQFDHREDVTSLDLSKAELKQLELHPRSSKTFYYHRSLKLTHDR